MKIFLIIVLSKLLVEIGAQCTEEYTNWMNGTCSSSCGLCGILQQKRACINGCSCSGPFVQYQRCSGDPLCVTSLAQTNPCCRNSSKAVSMTLKKLVCAPFGNNYVLNIKGQTQAEIDLQIAFFTSFDSDVLPTLSPVVVTFSNTTIARKTTTETPRETLDLVESTIQAASEDNNINEEPSKSAEIVTMLNRDLEISPEASTIETTAELTTSFTATSTTTRIITTLPTNTTTLLTSSSTITTTTSTSTTTKPNTTTKVTVTTKVASPITLIDSSTATAVINEPITLTAAAMTAEIASLSSTATTTLSTITPTTLKGIEAIATIKTVATTANPINRNGVYASTVNSIPTLITLLNGTPLGTTTSSPGDQMNQTCLETYSDWVDVTECTATCGLCGTKSQIRQCTSSCTCPCKGLLIRKIRCGGPQTCQLGPDCLQDFKEICCLNTTMIIDGKVNGYVCIEAKHSQALFGPGLNNF